MTSGSITTKDLTEENKIFFKYLTLKAFLLRKLTKPSEHAADYELRNAHTTLVQTIGDKILASKDWSGIAWDESSTRMLDYACGTGLISRVCFFFQTVSIRIYLLIWDCRSSLRIRSK